MPIFILLLKSVYLLNKAIIGAKHGSKEAERSQQLVPYLCDMLDKTPEFRNDILVDDRDWLTIGSRLIDCKLLGIPFVIVLGKCIHDEQVEIVLNSHTISKNLEKQKHLCHSRETAHVLKQLINDFLYKKKEQKFTNYFNKLSLD